MIKKEKDGTFRINGRSFIVNNWDPCADCDIESECDDMINEYCKKNLKPNECFAANKK